MTRRQCCHLSPISPYVNSNSPAAGAGVQFSVHTVRTNHCTPNLRTVLCFIQVCTMYRYAFLQAFLNYEKGLLPLKTVFVLVRKPQKDYFKSPCLTIVFLTPPLRYFVARLWKKRVVNASQCRFKMHCKRRIRWIVPPKKVLAILMLS